MENKVNTRHTFSCDNQGISQDADQYIIYTRSSYGRRQYVTGVSEGHYTPGYTTDPSQAQRMTRQMCREVDQSTDRHLHIEPWTPALQEMLEEDYTPHRTMHYSHNISILDESARTICGNVIHRDSVTESFAEVTCDICIRKAHGEARTGRDMPRGYWPIKGKYFGDDIRTLPAKYWCWVVYNTDMVKPGSYLHDFFLQHEATFRRRAGLKPKKIKSKI